MKNILLIVFLVSMVNLHSRINQSQDKVIELEPIDVTPLPREHRLRIAVIDTGLAHYQINQPYMCKDKPYITLPGDEIGFDRDGHGTNVIGLIGERIDVSKYCITSYGIHHWSSFEKYLEMLDMVEKDKPHALNLSWASPGYSYVEFDMLQKFAEELNITVVVAAGNKAQHMTEKNCDMYPSCHGFKIKKNFHVVGSTTKWYTNYGVIVKAYIPGDKVGNPEKTGTSQSAAIYTGQLFSK